MLAQQNTKLVKEIENIIECNSDMLNVLHRKEYLESLLQHTKIEIDASLNSFNIHHEVIFYKENKLLI